MLAVFILGSLAARGADRPVSTHEIESDAVGRTLKYNVILPEGYETGDERYPTLYLLHGLTSNYQAWARLGVTHYAQFFDMIVIMPDAGNSWYVNWAESEDGQKNDWEDFFIKELIPHVDEEYRTIARREGRAINGLSMGGYGGLMLGLRNRELFVSIGSHSGALALAQQAGDRIGRGENGRSGRRRGTEVDPSIGIEGFSSQADRSPSGKMFLTAEGAAAHDPFKLVLDIATEELPHIYLDCGTEDGLIHTNREFAQLLMENDIAFTYAQSGGRHNPPYWAREVGHSMSVQYHIMERALGRRIVELRRSPPPPPRAERRSESFSIEVTQGEWPTLNTTVEGVNEVKIENRNAFEVTVGLRIGTSGADFRIPPMGKNSVKVPNGRYRFFFRPTSAEGSFFEAQQFRLRNQNLELKLVRFQFPQP